MREVSDDIFTIILFLLKLVSESILNHFSVVSACQQLTALQSASWNSAKGDLLASPYEDPLKSDPLFLF